MLQRPLSRASRWHDDRLLPDRAAAPAASGMQEECRCLGGAAPESAGALGANITRLPMKTSTSSTSVRLKVDVHVVAEVHVVAVGHVQRRLHPHALPDAAGTARDEQALALRGLARPGGVVLVGDLLAPNRSSSSPSRPGAASVYSSWAAMRRRTSRSRSSIAAPQAAADAAASARLRRPSRRRPWASRMPSSTRTAPTGSCQLNRSASSSTPSATPTTGVTYVTVEVPVGPQARSTLMFQM